MSRKKDCGHLSKMQKEADNEVEDREVLYTQLRSSFTQSLVVGE
jgi:hypothetical protein